MRPVRFLGRRVTVDGWSAAIQDQIPMGCNEEYQLGEKRKAHIVTRLCIATAADHRRFIGHLNETPTFEER